MTRRPARISLPFAIALLASACASAGATPGAAAAQDHRAPRDVAVDTIFHGLDARPIGPPGTSGRIASRLMSDGSVTAPANR